LLAVVQQHNRLRAVFVSLDSYETLEYIDPDTVFGDALEYFSHHQLMLLSAAEKKLIKGIVHDGKLLINNNVLRMD